VKGKIFPVKTRRNRAGREDIGAFSNLRGLPYTGGNHLIKDFPSIRIRPDAATPGNVCFIRRAAAAAKTQV
jgi:hypothetical protein